MKRQHLSFYISIGILSVFYVTNVAVKNHGNGSVKEEIIGIWVNTKYADGSYELTRSKKLLRGNPGFEFKPDGSMIRRQNVSWCGTPPITYGNYDGQWSLQEKDSILYAKFDFWGGQFDVKYKITSLNGNELVLKVLESKTLKNE